MKTDHETFSAVIRRVSLLICGMLVVLLCAACSSSSKDAAGYTKGYNTPENMQLFIKSPLYVITYNIYTDKSRYLSPVDIMPTTPMEPFLAITVRDQDGKKVWSVCGGTSETIDLENVKTVALCVVSERTSQYKGSNGVTVGSAEDVSIYYIDAVTGECIHRSGKTGNNLPQYSKNTPHYTLSDDDIVSQIRKDLVPPYTLSPEGEITGGKLDNSLNYYRFPDNVKKITKLEIGDKIDNLRLPASIVEIAPDAIPRLVKQNKAGNAEDMVLTVLPDTYGESFARENGYVYQYKTSQERSSWVPQYVWVNGCECTFSRNGGSGCPVEPDGSFADWVKAGRILYVEKGSPAEKYAQDHQYVYSYLDTTNQMSDYEIRFCIGGQEWVRKRYNVMPSNTYICVPAGGTADPKLMAWVKKNAEHVIVAPGSADEENCRAAGLDCMLGDITAAEVTGTDENGTIWQSVFSMEDMRVLAIHVPASYQQNQEELNREKLCRDAGVHYNQWDRPLYFVQPGSWMTEHAQGWVEEGSTVLHASNDDYINAYNCACITAVADSKLSWDGMIQLLDYGVKYYTIIGRTRWNGYPFCLKDQPETMYYWEPGSGENVYIHNDRTLQGITTLKIKGDMTDERELAQVLARAGQDEPFLLKIEAGTNIEAFARQNGISYEIWVNPSSEDFLE